MRWRRLARVAVVDAVAWAGVQVAAGYLVHRLPDAPLESDGWLLRERSWERGGRLYTDVLRIRRWKRLLPEAGAVFAGGFDKRHLAGRDPDALRRHARETRRAELAHWLAMAPTPLFVGRNPPLLAPFMVLYGVAVNAPCIAAQRYNRIRLRRAEERLLRRPPGPGAGDAPRTGPRSPARPAGAAPWAPGAAACRTAPRRTGGGRGATP